MKLKDKKKIAKWLVLNYLKGKGKAVLKWRIMNDLDLFEGIVSSALRLLKKEVAKYITAKKEIEYSLMKRKVYYGIR